MRTFFYLLTTALLLINGSFAIAQEGDDVTSIESNWPTIWTVENVQLPGFSVPTYVPTKDPEDEHGPGSYYQDLLPGTVLFAGREDDTLVNKETLRFLNALATMPDKPRRPAVYLGKGELLGIEYGGGFSTLLGEPDPVILPPYHMSFTFTGTPEAWNQTFGNRFGPHGQLFPGDKDWTIKDGEADIDRLDFSDDHGYNNRIIIGVPTQPDGRMLYGELQPSCGLTGYVAPQEATLTTVRRTSGALPFKVEAQGYGSMILQKSGGSYVQVTMPSQPGVYILDEEYGAVTMLTDANPSEMPIAFSIVPIEDSAVEIKQPEETTEGANDLSYNKYYGLSGSINATGTVLYEDLSYNAAFLEPGIELDIRGFRFGAYAPIGYMESSPEQYMRWESTWFAGIRIKVMWDVLPTHTESRFGPYVSYTLLKGFSGDQNSVMQEVGTRAGIDYLHLGSLGLEFDYRRWSFSGGFNFTPWDFGSYGQPNDHRNDKTLTGDMHNGAWGLSATVGYRLIQPAKPQAAFRPVY